MPSPLVSILCATYNHAPYIRQCLDGFIMQKTDFPIEVIIHDDASTDNTADIIREYELKYPEIIKPIYQAENQYSKGISGTMLYQVYIYPRAQGKYIAFCEGDDYWTDPLKLQKQVDFLENNPKYGMCYTKALNYLQLRNKFEKKTLGNKVNSLEELFTGINPAPTLSVCLRKDLLFKYIEEIKPETRNWRFIGDIQVVIWFAYNSKIFFIDEITGVYRIARGSAFHPATYEKAVSIYEEIYRARIFFSKLYGHPELEGIINEHKISTLTCEAIKFKKYNEYKSYIAMSKGTTMKTKLKKMIGKSKILMIMYYYYLSISIRKKY